MVYYDNVKDNVKDGEGADTPSFDTLKEKAEETSEKDDEEKGDDTPIEVLEDGGLSRESPSRNESKQRETQNSRAEKESSSANSDAEQSSGSSGNSFKQAAQSSEGSGNGSMDAVEQKLDRIIEQNERMIEILESFGS